MDESDDLRIETPEQIDLQFELAGLGTRTVSWMFDALIKQLVTLALVLVVVAVAGFLDGKSVDADIAKFGGVFIGMVIAFFWILYDIAFELCWSGQTPGKRVMGARVVRDGGSPTDFTSSCIRNFLAMGDFLPIGYLLGATLIALTGKRQRLGDLAAGTIVIRERSKSAASRADKMVEQFAVAEIVFSASQLSRCTGADRRLLRSFLHRLFQMPPAARYQLAGQLADRLKKRMDVPPTSLDETPDSIAWLASLMRDLDQKAERGY